MHLKLLVPVGQRRRQRVRPVDATAVDDHDDLNSSRHMEPLIRTKSLRLKFPWSCLLFARAPQRSPERVNTRRTPFVLAPLLDLHPLPSTCPLFLVGHQLRSTNKRQYPFRDMTDNRFGLPPATVMAGGLPPGDPAPPCSVRERDATYQQVVAWPSRWRRRYATRHNGCGGAHRSMPVAPAGTS